MIYDKKVCVIMPAYNAYRTLERTFAEVDRTIVDEIIVVDDASSDQTAKLLEKLGVTYAIHKKNMGYGANQKTCYAISLQRGADIVVMLHPDYQYDPKLVPAMAHMIGSGIYDVVLASRILGKGAVDGGMPVYKFISNRILTLLQNLLIGQKLSEYHTGFRAFSRKVLETIPILENSDDFVFDNQMVVQCHYWGFKIGEISCPTKYFKEASSIGFLRSCRYGAGVIQTSLQFLAAKWHLSSPPFLTMPASRQSLEELVHVEDKIEKWNLPKET